MELPVHAGAVRRPARAARRQRGRAQARRPDHAHRAARACSCSRRPASRKDLWQVVAGPGREIGPEIIGRADYVCFTGSTATGRQIAKQCAERLIGCSLELGGKNPILVLRDADVDRAAEGAVRASFSNAGQLCVSTERMFVADQVYDRVRRPVRGPGQGDAAPARAGLGRRHGLADLAGSSSTPSPRTSRTPAPRASRVLAGGRARPDLGPLLLRADRPRGRHARTWQCFGERDLRAGRLGLPVLRRGRRDRPRQRRRVRPERLASTPRTAPAAARSPGRSSAARSTSTRRSPRRSPASTPRWAACASPVSAAARAPRACCATPRRSRSPPSGCCRFGPMLGLSDERYAKVMTAQLRLLKKLGRA